jgi:hypothetical protein
MKSRCVILNVSLVLAQQPSSFFLRYYRTPPIPRIAIPISAQALLSSSSNQFKKEAGLSRLEQASMAA